MFRNASQPGVEPDGRCQGSTTAALYLVDSVIGRFQDSRSRWTNSLRNVASIRRRNLCSDGIYVHLYDNSVLDWHLENGVGLKVAQKTNYPWDGEVQLPVTPAQPSNFSFYLRIAGWAESAQLSVNGKAYPGRSRENIWRSAGNGCRAT
jgi:hypothetical protein